MGYRPNKNWVERWHRKTGNRPDEKLLKRKQMNNYGSHRTLMEDALKRASRKFWRKHED